MRPFGFNAVALAVKLRTANDSPWPQWHCASPASATPASSVTNAQL